MSNNNTAAKRTSKPKTPEGKVFGETLERLRTARGLTQEALAHEAGLTTNYTPDLERGQKVRSLTTILQLAHALQCSPTALLSDFTPAMLRRATGR